MFDWVGNMEKTNRNFASDIEDALLEGLLDRVISMYKQRLNRKEYIDTIHRVLREEGNLPREEAALKEDLDIAHILKLIAHAPDDVKDSIKKKDNLVVTYAHELLQGLRNTNSHNKRENRRKLDDDAIRRFADTATRLLTALGGRTARDAAEKVKDIEAQFSRRLMPEQDKSGGIPIPAPDSVSSNEPQKAASLASKARRQTNGSSAIVCNTGQDPIYVEGIKEDYSSIDPEARQESEYRQPEDVQSERSPRMTTDNYHDPDLARLTQEESAVSDSPTSGGKKQRKRFSLINFSPTIINSPNISPTNVSNPNISPSIQQNVSPRVNQNVGVGSALAAEDFNKTAFAAGLITGVFGVMGLAHLLNGKVLLGILMLIVGTVCYWVFIILLAGFLVSVAEALVLLALGIHLLIVYKLADKGARKKKARA